MWEGWSTEAASLERVTEREGTQAESRKEDVPASADLEGGVGVACLLMR